MSDSQNTRVVRLRADIDREHADNEQTSYFDSRAIAARVVLVDHRALFNHHQLRMHQLLREYPKPGVVVFALHHSRGLAGHLWLEASGRLRAGTIGRHNQVDLYLADDEKLSLRHLLVLVRRRAEALWLRVVDLATPGGFQAEEGGVLRAVSANGTLVLRAASYSLFLIPTGEPPPWDPDSEDPWLTLPGRVVAAEEKLPPSQPPLRQRERETNVTREVGPIEPGPGPALGEGEAAVGTLWLANHSKVAEFQVGATALERGIILGRYSRCVTDSELVTDAVSRVHAVLMSVEGQVHLIDAGSTNGIVSTARPDVEWKCGPVEEGGVYQLGKMTVRWEPRS